MNKYRVRIVVNSVGERDEHKLIVEAPTIKDVKGQITEGNFIIVDLPIFGDKFDRTYINVDHVVKITITEVADYEK